MRGIEMVEGRVADRTEQNGIAREACLQRRVREGGAMVAERRSANRMLMAIELVAARSANELEHSPRLIRHFGADAVARKNRDRQTHGLISCCCRWSAATASMM